MGGISLLTGVLLILSAVYTRGHHPDLALPAAGAPEEMAEESGPAAPLLGALLVYKYRLITDEQLKRALEEQRKRPGQRRLGEILLDMGLITRGSYGRPCSSSDPIWPVSAPASKAPRSEQSDPRARTPRNYWSPSCATSSTLRPVSADSGRSATRSRSSSAAASRIFTRIQRSLPPGSLATRVRA